METNMIYKNSGVASLITGVFRYLVTTTRVKTVSTTPSAAIVMKPIPVGDPKPLYEGCLSERKISKIGGNSTYQLHVLCTNKQFQRFHKHCPLQGCTTSRLLRWSQFHQKYSAQDLHSKVHSLIHSRCSGHTSHRRLTQAHWLFND